MNSRIDVHSIEQVTVPERTELATPIIIFLLCAIPIAGACAVTGHIEPGTFLAAVLTIIIALMAGGSLYNFFKRASAFGNIRAAASYLRAVRRPHLLQGTREIWFERVKDPARRHPAHVIELSVEDRVQFLMNKSARNRGTLHLFNPLLP